MYKCHTLHILSNTMHSLYIPCKDHNSTTVYMYTLKLHCFLIHNSTHMLTLHTSPSQSHQHFTPSTPTLHTPTSLPSYANPHIPHHHTLTFHTSHPTLSRTQSPTRSHLQQLWLHLDAQGVQDALPIKEPRRLN